MTLLACVVVGVLFAASVYLLLGGELKEICMGIFLLGHGANVAIVAASGSPIGRVPPVLTEGADPSAYVDPLPQALVLTAIVIGFAVQAFLLTLLVSTWRCERTLDVDDLAGESKEPSVRH
ncbi:MAG TPA: sodium:proton antiporter [Tepidisphaeraceae bacterium]|nr:sodium:proton antiporter [Tepidisphaeraceae bacterium]